MSTARAGPVVILVDFLSLPLRKRKRKNYVGGEAPPTSVKERETHWLQRAVSLPHHDERKKEEANGDQGGF